MIELKYTDLWPLIRKRPGGGALQRKRASLQYLLTPDRSGRSLCRYSLKAEKEVRGSQSQWLTYNKALPQYMKVLELSPKSTTSACMAGASAVRMANLDKAKELFQLAKISQKEKGILNIERRIDRIHVWRTAAQSLHCLFYFCLFWRPNNTMHPKSSSPFISSSPEEVGY